MERRNFDPQGSRFHPWRADLVGPAGLEGGPIAAPHGHAAPPGTPRWGAGYRDFLAKYYTRHTVIAAH